MSVSAYLMNSVLDHVFNGVYYPPPTVYLAVSTVDPGADGSSIQEPSDSEYARIACSDWTSASNGQISNSSAVGFETAGADWGTITHVALYDAASGGRFLASAALDSSVTVNTGFQLVFQEGAIVIRGA